MKKSVFVLFVVLGVFVGIFVKGILEWLNIDFSFANVWELMFGEPTFMTTVFVILLTALIAFAVIFPFYKKYVN